MAKKGKRLEKAYEGIDPMMLHPLAEAVKLIKGRSSAKFDETVELAMNLNIDPRKPDQNLRGTLMLPHGTGKTDRFRPRDRHSGYDVDCRTARQDPGAARPDAEPAARHGYGQCQRGGARRKGRTGGVPCREGGRCPCRRREGKLYRGSVSG